MYFVIFVIEDFLSCRTGGYMIKYPIILFYFSWLKETSIDIEYLFSLMPPDEDLKQLKEYLCFSSLKKWFHKCLNLSYNCFHFKVTKCFYYEKEKNKADVSRRRRHLTVTLCHLKFHFNSEKEIKLYGDWQCEVFHVLTRLLDKVVYLTQFVTRKDKLMFWF